MLQRRIEFLGFDIENGTIKVSSSKTRDVQRYREPTSMKSLQRFLGFTGYFRKFIEDYAKIAKPLSDLLRKEVKFEFGEVQRAAFEQLKKLITEKPILTIFKYGLETEVHTDASKLALAARSY